MSHVATAREARRGRRGGREGRWGREGVGRICRDQATRLEVRDGLAVEWRTCVLAGINAGELLPSGAIPFFARMRLCRIRRAWSKVQR